MNAAASGQRPAIAPAEAAREAMGTWTPFEVRARLVDRWAPVVLARFPAAVRAVHAALPDGGRRPLVEAARAVLSATATTQAALCVDPALARWCAVALDAPLQPSVARRLAALAPRFTLAAALLDGRDADVAILPGPSGVARVPVDGRRLLGTPGVPMVVRARAGALDANHEPARMAGAFQVVAGDEEEGKMPRFRPHLGAAAEAALSGIEPGVAALAETAPATLAEALALAPVLAPIEAEPGVSRSASIPDVRGVIWLSPTERPLVMAETLVHEASHVKYYLVEDLTALSLALDRPKYEVPWRPDPRPIRTVLMGLHAWVRVARWLRTLERGRWAQPASERLAVLLPATQDAARIVASAFGLTEAGRALADALNAEAATLGAIASIR